MQKSSPTTACKEIDYVFIEVMMMMVKYKSNALYLKSQLASQH